MVKNILVVGVNGFVGKHLVRELTNANLSVNGTGLDTVADSEIGHLLQSYTQCDMTNTEHVERINLEGIDAIINLAALATPSQTSLPDELYYTVNITTHTNLLDRLVVLGKKPRVMAVSSGAVYDSAQPMPLTEESKLITSGSPYALSKVMLEEKLKAYREKGLEIIVARPLNHTGPGQGPGFIVPDLTKRIANDDKLVVGPLNTSRDYTHVDDVVRAYRLLMTHEGPLPHTVYNICSGVATSRDQLIELIEKALGKENIPIEVDQNIGRPNDPMSLYGSYQRIHDDVDWKPSKQLADIIQDYVEWVRSN